MIKNVRKLNITVFVLLQLVRYFDEFYIFSIILSYLHIIMLVVFFSAEIINVFKTNNYRCNWMSILGFVVLMFTLVKIYLGKN